MENEASLDKDIQQNELVRSSFEIKYKPATVFHRVMANLLDFLIFLLLGFAIFLLCRNIISESESYKSAYKAYRGEQISSSLYYNDGSALYPTITSYIDDGGFTHAGKHQKSKEAVESFYVYSVNNLSSENLQTLQNGLTSYLLDNELVNQDGYKFIEAVSFEGNVLTITESSQTIRDLDYYAEVYKPLIEDQLLPFFSNYSQTYKSNLTYVSKLFVLVALPISYVSSGLLTYFVPPLFFRRGRQTLGKALYHIGLVGPDFLSVKFPRFLGRFGVFYVLELLIAPFTFLVPFLVSFTMMMFTSKKESFADYMSKTREVDISNNKIYFSHSEIVLNGIPGTKKPVDFKPEREI